MKGPQGMKTLKSGTWMRSAGLACALMIGAAGPVSAEETEPVRMTYEVYFGGFHIASAKAALDRSTGGYTLTADAYSRGMLDFFFSWRGETKTAGRFVDGAAVPTTHENFGDWNGSTRTVAVSYTPDGGVADVLVEPPADPEEVNALPENAEDGTVDPLSVVAQLSEAMTLGSACAGEFKVFDGRRRYDLTVTDMGSSVFEPNDFSVFDGEAKACGIDFTLLGGDRKEKSKYAKTARNRVVYVGRPLAEAPAIPVRLKIETAYGMLMAHLTAVSADGKQLALKPD